MNGPKFVRFFSPVIKALKELVGSGRPSEVRDFIAKQLNISEQERTDHPISHEVRSHYN